jgi:hypothetical protein
MRVEIRKAIQNAFGDFPQHLFSRSASQLLNLAINRVQGSTLTEFHGDADGTGAAVLESAIVAADVVAGAGSIESELSHDLFLHGRIGVGSDNLQYVNMVLGRSESAVVP